MSEHTVIDYFMYYYFIYWIFLFDYFRQTQFYYSCSQILSCEIEPLINCETSPFLASYIKVWNIIFYYECLQLDKWNLQHKNIMSHLKQWVLRWARLIKQTLPLLIIIIEIISVLVIIRLLVIIIKLQLKQEIVLEFIEKGLRPPVDL